MSAKPQSTVASTPPSPGFLGESWRAWLALAVGVLAVSAHSALSLGMSPLLKPITDDLGWTRTQYATAMNFRMVLLMAVAPFAGQLVDRFGARVVLALGALAMGLGTLAFASVQSLGELYLISLLIGPGQACIGSVAGSALVLRMFQRRRGVAIGVLNGGDNLITSGVHVTTAALLVEVGWRGALSALGAGYLTLGALIYLVLRADEGGGQTRSARAGQGGSDRPAERAAGARRPASDGARLRDLPWSTPALWLLIVTYVLVYAFITSVGIHFPAFQRDLGRSPEVAAWIYGLSTMVGAFGSVACGWFTERWSARTALVLTVAGLAATSVVLWLPVGTTTYYGWAVVYGVMNASAVALLALVLNELFGAVQIGRLMGVAMVFCMAGTIAGNHFSAAMFDALGGYTEVWRVYTVAMLIALVPALALWRVGRVARRSALQGP
ncbi:MAG TPA: MFS transporter [Candidatus Binatia bacterium]